MIITRIHGGLGNQLFQYALGHTLARRHQVPHKLHLESDPADRPFALAALGLTCERATPSEIAALAPQWGASLKNKYILWAHRLTPFAQRRWAKEQSFDFDSRVFDLRPPFYLDGWWQSERYFSARADELRERLRAMPVPSERAHHFGATIASRESVAVHVRRGDYQNDADASRFHGTCPVEYYQRACSWMRAHKPDALFYVFSDDPAWAREHIRTGGPEHYVSGTPAHDTLEDFYLMNRCKHFIIANSTFSWWPAWIQSHPGQRVVAPARWFLGHQVNPVDRFPEGWHLIDA